MLPLANAAATLWANCPAYRMLVPSPSPRRMMAVIPVSYTHLTLPTKRIV